MSAAPPLSRSWAGTWAGPAGGGCQRRREVEVLGIDALPQERGDRFVARTGFDPRALATPYRWFRISPRRIQAWREVNELPDVLFEAGRIEPGDADGEREGGPAQQMETR